LNLTVNPILTRTIDASICTGETYNFYGTDYTATTTGLEHRFSNPSGCDSVVTLNLTVNSILTRTIDASICTGETYNFYGTDYTNAVSGLEHRFANTSGCDSVVTLNLTVNPTSAGVETVTICQGQSYIFNGVTYTTSNNTAKDTLQNSNGCDSIVTLNLTVLPDNLVRQHFNDALFFDNTSEQYVAWQWYKDSVAVTGATQPHYSEKIPLNGVYYVIATDRMGNTIQTCPLVFTGSTTVLGGMKLFPNPASGGSSVTLICGYTETQLQGAQVLITQTGTGIIMQQLAAVQPVMQLSVPPVSGIYSITLILSNGKKATINLLVK
jgi:hypothetical protein